MEIGHPDDESPGADVYVCGMEERPAWMHGIRDRVRLCHGEEDVISMGPIQRPVSIYLWTGRTVVQRCYDADTLSKWLLMNMSLPDRADLSNKQIAFIWSQTSREVHERLRAYANIHVDLAEARNRLDYESEMLRMMEWKEVHTPHVVQMDPAYRREKRKQVRTVLGLQQEHSELYRDMLAAQRRAIE